VAEGLKAMALEGHGLAFLPGSSVKKELKSKRLVRVAAPGVCELSMEVRIYRERPEMARHIKPGAHALRVARQRCWKADWAVWVPAHLGRGAAP